MMHLFALWITECISRWFLLYSITTAEDSGCHIFTSRLRPVRVFMLEQALSLDQRLHVIVS